MSTQPVLDGTVHVVPNDLRAMLTASADIGKTWNGLTALGRNEFICWVMSAKKPETRARRIEIACDKITRGERRPCCWPGCPHREKNGV
ncbi:MAG: YdeI/OmpD-associated family protein [Candidatus Saccharimonadales bacterium]